MRSALIFSFAAMLASAASAQTPSGAYRYGSERQCVSARVFSSTQCHIAQANAGAEFDEKVPHFPTRAACEQAFGRSRCMIGPFASLGARKGVYFVPQSDGFVISVRSADQIGVAPLARVRTAGRFQSRSIARLNTSRTMQAHVRAGVPGSPGRAFGDAVPTGVKGELPPAPYSDPGFDCGAIVEPSRNRDDPGCFPVSPSMRRHLEQRD